MSDLANPKSTWETKMVNEILSYLEMCQREGVSLQRGMNFGLGGNYSVILMSRRPNAPYNDQLENEGTVLIYEGHDIPRSERYPNPKTVDQAGTTPGGKYTQNGKFYEAAAGFKNATRPPERVRVYEKIRQGIWSYNGVFYLVDAWREQSEGRLVFKFKLMAVEEDEDFTVPPKPNLQRRRVIPTSVKLEVWKRDQGRCVMCGATDELHFDHILPFLRGGTSARADNVQLLCARHNIQKSDKII